MAKKKNLYGQLTDTQNAATSWITPTEEEPARASRKMTSFFVDPETYKSIKALADYRASQGYKNDRGQPFSGGALINEALHEYIERHQDDLKEWERVQRMIADIKRKD